MKKSHLAALFLALVMLLTLLPVSALAVESVDWLIPPTREYRDFTDTPGTICEKAAAICCRAGLMDGVDSKHFLPSSGLSHAQIIVISARLHRLLSGGTLEYFEPISLKGLDWWTPYDGYLREQLPALAEDNNYQGMRGTPTDACYRYEFFLLLAAVLAETGTTLPERNQVQAVPDCADREILQFYRWGVLGGKDAFGTLCGSDALSRAAAAAMLARLIDPAQRLTLKLEPLELCRELLDVDPGTVLMTISGQDITAEEFMPTLVSTVSSYNHSHFAAMMLEMNGRTTLDEAMDTICRQVLCETLAEELQLDVAPVNEDDYLTGYQGLTAHGQAWDAYHKRLSASVFEALGSDFPADRLSQPEFTEIWDTLPFSELYWKVMALPYWGGHF